MREFRYCPVSYRDDSDGARVLTGTAVRYGDIASIGGRFRERIQPGAFGNIGDVILNFQHDRSRPLARTGGGGLTLLDSNEALKVRAILPETRDSRDALRLVSAGILRGLSIEFSAKEERFSDNVRVINRAVLHGIGLVDRPAYGESLATVAKRFQQVPSRIEVPAWRL